jgi:hypothetical protein
MTAWLGPMAGHPAGPPPAVCEGARHLTITHVTGVEGNQPAGPTKFVFEVMSRGCGVAMNLPYTFGPADSTNSADVASGAGVLQFAAGDLSTKTITVDVVPDNVAEHDEQFAVWLGQPNVRNAVLERCYGIGTIVNDDFGVPDGVPVGSRLHCSE